MVLKKGQFLKIALTSVTALLISLGTLMSMSGCKHIHEYTETVVAPTCTEEGYTEHVCGCGDSFRDNYTEVVPHNYVEIVDEEATCQAPGIKHMECEWCGERNGDDIIIEIVPHSYEEIMDKAATCTETGVAHTECKWCHVVGETITLPVTEHTFSEEVVEATCTTGGYTKKVCDVCGTEVIENEVNALGHDYQETNRVEPTETTKGSVTYTCSRCGDSYTEELASTVHQHTWDEGTQTKEPTCTERGIMVYTCTDCHETQTVYVNALGHDWRDQVIAPTCTEQGYTRHYCARCGVSENVSYVPAIGHDYTASVTKEPTCTEAGVRTYTCKHDAAHSYTEPIPAKGHSYQNGVCVNCGAVMPHEHRYAATITKPATCAEAGVRTYTCAVCNHTYTESIPALGHKYTDTTVAATCTSGGYVEHRCSVCGYSYRDNETSALGHDYQNYTVTQQPTCQAEGKEVGTCTRCQAKDERAIAKTSHNYVMKEHVAATCTTEGYDLYECSYCNATEHRNIVSALGHLYGEWTTATPATCQTEGKEERVCQHCGNKEERSIAKVAHSYVFSYTVQPTCTGEGYDVYICSTPGCGATEHRNTVPAKGHNFVSGVCTECGASEVCNHVYWDWVIVKQPSCVDGLRERTCRICNHVEQEAIPATGEHAWDMSTYAEHAATCTENSWYECVCADCGYHDITIEENTALGHDYQGTCARKECTRCHDVILGSHDVYDNGVVVVNFPDGISWKVYDHCYICKNCSYEIASDTVLTPEQASEYIEQGYDICDNGVPGKRAEK